MMLSIRSMVMMAAMVLGLAWGSAALADPAPAAPAAAAPAAAGDLEAPPELKAPHRLAAPQEIKARQELAAPHEHAAPCGDDVPSVATVVPLATFVMIVAIVAAVLFASYRRDMLRHATIRVIIEKGGEIPPSLLDPPARPRSDLRRGILLIATSLGLLVLLRSTTEGGVWTASLIPLLLGIGHLLVRKLEPSSRGPGDGPTGYRT
jgi:hypothetical protein